MKYDICLLHVGSPFLIHEDVFPPLGILYLAATLRKADISVQCLDIGIGHTIDMIESGIVGVSFTTPQKHEAFKIALELKKKGKLLIAGGAHPTNALDECRNYFDYIIRGEADVILPIFLLYQIAKKAHYDFPVISCKEYDNIDAFPFPDRDALPIKDYKYLIDGEPATTLMTSRGCPSACSFCARISKKFRAQSAERTIDEIDYIHEKYGFNAFMIFDDVFIADKNRLESISNHLHERDFIFRCFARSNLITEATVTSLKRMHTVEVGIGVESGSSIILKKNMKGTTPATNLKAFQLLQKAGIRAKAFIIVGLPGETKETIMETVDWLCVARPYDVDISIFQPMPGSPIYRNPKDFGIEIIHEPTWYKGIPGQYTASTREEGGLTSEKLIDYRNQIEDNFKRKELLI